VGLILDSSVAVATERRGDTVQAFLQRVIETAGDQEAALSPVGVVELVHGIHRADTAERRARREAFVEELFSTVAIYPLTTDIARRCDGDLARLLRADGQCAPLQAHSWSACDSALTCIRTARIAARRAGIPNPGFSRRPAADSH
jgi:predicted nucleic acid-binding protein